MKSTYVDSFCATLVTGHPFYSRLFREAWEAFREALDSGKGSDVAILERRSKTTGKVSYQALLDQRDPDTGVRNRVVIGTYATKRKAEIAFSKAITEREQGRRRKPDSTTVGELMAAWLASKAGEVSGNSHADYEQVIRLHIFPALGAVPVKTLTAARLQSQYTAWRDAGLSARMIRGCHMRLSQALKQAVRFGIIYVNPCDAVKPPTLERATVETWSAVEARCFLLAAENRPELNRAGDTGRRAPDPLWPLWPLLLLEGMRKGEALGLRWRDVDLDRGTASIAQTVASDKSNAGKVIIQPRAKTAAGARVVRLTPQTVAALREHRTRQNAARLAAAAWQDFNLIVCTAKGTPVNPGGNVNRSFDAIVKAARLPDGSPLRRIRIHDLRHTAATLLLGAGVPAKIVSERLGHATVSITLDLYSHVSPDMQADAAARMGAIFEPAIIEA